MEDCLKCKRNAVFFYSEVTQLHVLLAVKAYYLLYTEWPNIAYMEEK